ncbi:MAG: hypothetical protein ABSG17_13355 [Spirochaetia bacterium]|jgi:hypothetical protein
MTAVSDILTRLSALRCRAELSKDGVSIVGAVKNIPEELKAAARRAKPALVVELLREKARALHDTIDGDAPYEKRLARLLEYQETTDKLAQAQERLFASWREAGFTVTWSALVEEFILVGDAPPPPGSEGFVVYSLGEVEALKDASPERVIQAHKVKKAFAGTVAR